MAGHPPTGTREDYRGYINGQFEDHADCRSRPPMVRVLRPARTTDSNGQENVLVYRMHYLWCISFLRSRRSFMPGRRAAKTGREWARTAGIILCRSGVTSATLAALRQEVFWETHREGDTHATLEELEKDEEFMGTWGTGTVIDIYRVVDTTQAPDWRTGSSDYNTLRPLAPDRVQYHFDTIQPTVQQYRDRMTQAHAEVSRPYSHKRGKSLLDENEMRWTGLYVILYTDGEPTHAGIWGSSGD
jgi:hypothetical protein